MWCGVYRQNECRWNTSEVIERSMMTRSGIATAYETGSEEYEVKEQSEYGDETNEGSIIKKA